MSALLVGYTRCSTDQQDRPTQLQTDLPLGVGQGSGEPIELTDRSRVVGKLGEHEVARSRPMAASWTRHP